MWANAYAAYEALSETMQRLLSGLRAAFTGTVADDDGQRRDVVTYHPVVRTHPLTKRRALGHRPDRVGAALRGDDRRPRAGRCSSSSTSTARGRSSSTATGGARATS